MKIIGLTGSIGMGKSYVASEFAKHNIIVFDCDKEVALLYNSFEFLNNLKNYFPELQNKTIIDKNSISRIITGDSNKLKILEQIIHPIIRQKILHFIEIHHNEIFIILDIPLLYENNYEEICDAVIVVTATKDIQMQRLKMRPNFDETKINFIMKQQVPDEFKRLKADYLINTGISLEFTNKEVKKIIALIS